MIGVSRWAFYAILFVTFFLGVSSSFALLTLRSTHTNTSVSYPAMAPPSPIIEEQKECITTIEKEPQEKPKEEPKEEAKEEPKEVQEPVKQYGIDHPSPKDRIKEQDVHVLGDRIVINIKGARWAKFTPTHSMDPVFDTEAHALQIVPKSPTELQIGDVISYQTKNGTIIHRIIEIGSDSKGWYAIAKGDNNASPDPDKIRFKQIKKVMVGVIY